MPLATKVCTENEYERLYWVLEQNKIRKTLLSIGGKQNTKDSIEYWSKTKPKYLINGLSFNTHQMWTWDVALFWQWVAVGAGFEEL